ncbi:Late embryogenesis abundant protein group 6 [Euphorbia peplus]|nr:Late embryogenesis abundant protein group 6 [Euphorbia peplus]
MENNKKEEMSEKKQENEEKNNKELEGLPLESSPYVNYKDLEDYKSQAYGTQGHQPVKPNQGPGGTDAPTLSGTHLQQPQ